MRVGTFSKQPGEVISSSIVYDEALDDGDLIALVNSCVVTPPGLTASASLVAEKRVRVFVEGGTSGVSYKVTVTVTTDFGERFEDELICKVKEL